MRRLAVLAALALPLACAGAAQAGPCTRVVRPGIDLRKLARSLRAGDVACLRAGTYGRRGTYAAIRADGRPGRRIRLTAYPGDPRPRVLGQLEVAGNWVTVDHLLFDGPAGVLAGLKAIMVRVDGDHVRLVDNEIRRGQNQGVYLETAEHALVAGNYVHDNGDFADPARANLDHGIYFASGSGVVEGNVLAHNYAYGMQLYPSARSVVVRDNVIYGQGRAGVLVASAPGSPAPRDNLIATNLFADNALGAVQVLAPARAAVRSNLMLGGPAATAVPLVTRLWGWG
jgi:hypothetical protein